MTDVSDYTDPHDPHPVDQEHLADEHVPLAELPVAGHPLPDYNGLSTSAQLRHALDDNARQRDLLDAIAAQVDAADHNQIPALVGSTRIRSQLEQRLDEAEAKLADKEAARRATDMHLSALHGVTSRLYEVACGSDLAAEYPSHLDAVRDVLDRTVSDYQGDDTVRLTNTSDTAVTPDENVEAERRVLAAAIAWRHRVLSPLSHLDAEALELADAVDAVPAPEDLPGGQPCQPIGCDAGIHLPGCAIGAAIEADLAQLEAEDPTVREAAQRLDDTTTKIISRSRPDWWTATHETAALAGIADARGVASVPSPARGSGPVHLPVGPGGPCSELCNHPPLRSGGVVAEPVLAGLESRLREAFAAEMPVERPLSASYGTYTVLGQIASQRAVQGAVGDRPDGTSPEWRPAADFAARELLANADHLTWQMVLAAEYWRTIAATDPAEIRGLLVRLCMVAVAWAEAIDGRAEAAIEAADDAEARRTGGTFAAKYLGPRDEAGAGQ